jgi:hypothetical protein
MEAVKEITVWDSAQAPNHTYLLDGTSLVAYVRQGDSKPYYFKTPIKGFDRRGRKFEPADIQIFDLDQPSPAQSDTDTIIEVKGSKSGVVYRVNTQEHTCTCPGYTFRGDCKHVKELADA